MKSGQLLPPDNLQFPDIFRLWNYKSEVVLLYPSPFLLILLRSREPPRPSPPLTDRGLRIMTWEFCVACAHSFSSSSYSFSPVVRRYMNSGPILLGHWWKDFQLVKCKLCEGLSVLFTDAYIPNTWECSRHITADQLFTKQRKGLQVNNSCTY